VSLNFEETQSIVINVKATELGTGGTFTQAITINVRDLPEQPQTMSLSNTTVAEKTPGAVVGDVLLDDLIPDNRYTFTVDDSRFEVAGHVLKLVDGVSVDIATQSEIQLQITANDSRNQFNSIAKSFVIAVIKGDKPFHNDDFPEDVDDSGTVTAGDALEIVHYLNVYGPGPVGQGDPGYGYDVNGDGSVTALDALIVINMLNRLRFGGGGGTVGGEPEQPAKSDNKLAASPLIAPPKSPIAPDSGNSASGSQPNQSQAARDRLIAQFGILQGNASLSATSADIGPAGTVADETADAAIHAFVRLFGDS
jgi:Dockerin type I domain